jgi:catechol 2,3-dioxygenase-like lactoylglutathione lyase family enzyme
MQVPPLHLDHVTLSCGRIDETIAFYGDILGLRPGFRPPLEANGVKVPGAWLYAEGGDYPILHLIDRKPEGSSGTGAFHHFALRGTGLLTFLDHLRANAVEFRASPVADTADTQVHFFDPNGVKVEMIFAERGDPGMLA